MSKTTSSARPLTGYALTHHFRKLRLRWDFTHLEAYLFFELVAICNEEGWPVEFSVKNLVLTGALTCSEKGLIKARKTLASAGLLTYTEGQNRRPTAYRFCSAEGLPEVSITDSKHLPEGLPEVSDKAENEGKHLPKGLPEGLPEVSPYKEQTKTKTTLSEGVGVGAQNLTSPTSEQAATPLPAVEKKPAGKRAKKVGADLTEIAALPLPHVGPAFAKAWLTFYTQNTKQAGKPLTAFELMLKKLGSRPEAFAVVMLEAAIQGDWSGVENPGTARAFATWQAEHNSRPPAALPTPVAAEEEELDEPARLFRAQLAAEAKERQKAHLARWSANP